jgi:L-ribulokinase
VAEGAGFRHPPFPPPPPRAGAYDDLYAHYSDLHDRFGRDGVMHSLRRLRTREVAP